VSLDGGDFILIQGSSGEDRGGGKEDYQHDRPDPDVPPLGGSDNVTFIHLSVMLATHEEKPSQVL